MDRRRLPWPLSSTGAWLAALGAMLAAGCGPMRVDGGPAPPDASALDSGSLHGVEVRTWPRVVSAQGSLLADERAVIGAKVAGRVKSVEVDLGAAVCPGDVLANLESEEFDLRVQQAQAQLEQVRTRLGLRPGQEPASLDPAKVPAVVQAGALRNEAKYNLERATALIAQNAITREELQDREAAYEVAESGHLAALNDVQAELALLAVRQAELGLARQALDDATIRAPFQGIIEQRHAAPGAYVQVGAPLLRIVRTDPLRFHAGVPEREASQLRLKQAVRIRIEGQPTPIESTIARISPSLDMASRSLAVQADVPNADLGLRAGLFAQAEIVVEPEAKALAVPAGAIREFAGVEKVFVAVDGRPAERVVETGRRIGPWVEIRRGLAAGDRIVADPATVP